MTLLILAPAVPRKIALAWLCRVSNMYSACSRVFVFDVITLTNLRKLYQKHEIPTYKSTIIFHSSPFIFKGDNGLALL
ncbi:hypothetical protein Fleli_0405 [Bernardetia litoralis DSM 6794]|uniref:Uncharacterized protein n=1 Tax=Bernardetia litoralis (strain ATCC 23117 / DSM 6794 / NBRC 15988 / NCIMB 1366 / Fx l1 / Sio-4) TaxID=880071 RepID=I4AFZ6_BERLS|nr:hypothetical protein Fleli_0405 [Bernardetia litoralis DSM 6794]